jgi:hypothetical protein
MVTDDNTTTGAPQSLRTTGQPDGEPADVMLARFLLGSTAAQTAASLLRDGAEVAVTFTDVAGEWRFYSDAAKPAMEPGKAQDPDFELRLAPGAVRSICSMPDANIGELGIAFFEHVVSREPDYRIRVQLHSGLIKLTRRGWLGLLARGGPNLAGWMAKKGFRGSSAVVAALARLKSSR